MQFRTDSRPVVRHSATMNQTEVKAGYGETVLLDERRWQAWVLKNRELDRVGAARRSQLLLATMGIAALCALFWGWLLR